MLFSPALAAKTKRVASDGVLRIQGKARGGHAQCAASAQQDPHGPMATRAEVEDLRVKLGDAIQRTNADMLRNILRMQEETAAIALMPQIAAGNEKAAEALVRLGDAARDRVLALKELLRDNLQVSEAAATALGELGTAARVALPALKEAAAYKGADAARGAVKKVAGALADFASETANSSLAEEAVQALAEDPTFECMDGLRKLTVSESLKPELRKQAMEGLVKLLEKDQLVEDSDCWKGREATAVTLGGLGAAVPGDFLPQAIEALAKALRYDKGTTRAPIVTNPHTGYVHKDPKYYPVSRAAASALGSLGAAAGKPANQVAVEALNEYVKRFTECDKRAAKGEKCSKKYRDGGIMNNAIHALGRLGLDAEAAIPALKVVADDYVFQPSKGYFAGDYRAYATRALREIQK